MLARSSEKVNFLKREGISMLKLLLKPKITMTALAKEYGCSPEYVSMVTNNKKLPSTNFKLFCSEKFGLPVNVLFPEERRPRSGGTSVDY